MSNNLIKILAEQAGATTMERSGGTDYGTLDLDVEKFAELIVKECADKLIDDRYFETFSEYYDGFNEALVYGANKIKKHFGVE